MVLAFVAHHLEVGASEIFLFFDDPEDPAYDLVVDQPGVQAFRCDAAHWAALAPRRPPGHLRRQVLNVALARSRSRADWLGHIDIDEFIWSKGAFTDVLAAIVPEDPVLRLLPAERVFTHLPGPNEITAEGGFKLRMPDRLAGQLFGDFGPLMSHGFQGHTIGKTFVRQGVKCQLTIHRAKDAIGNRIDGPAEYRSARLLHFFPFGFAAWEEKFARRLKNPRYLEGRRPEEQRKFRLFAEARDRGSDAVWELFLAMSYLDRRRLEKLRRRGYYFEPELGLSAAVRRVFGPDAPALEASVPPTGGSAKHVRRKAVARATRVRRG